MSIHSISANIGTLACIYIGTYAVTTQPRKPIFALLIPGLCNRACSSSHLMHVARFGVLTDDPTIVVTSTQKTNKTNKPKKGDQTVCLHTLPIILIVASTDSHVL